MSAKHLTPAMIDRTVHVIDTSKVLDLACPPHKPGQAGRIGAIRHNTWLLLIGWHLCTRLGHETTIQGAYEVLTQAVPRDRQWELGILRPRTSALPSNYTAFDPDETALVKKGKQRKRIWVDDGVEEIGYDDLRNAAKALSKRLDYGRGSAPDLADGERAARRLIVETIIDALIGATTIERTGSTWAIDATGQWAWSRGPAKRKKQLEKMLADAKADGDPEPGALEVADIAFDEDGATAPVEQLPPPRAARGRCLDAEWGYRTGKSGEKEVGFGFHQHTIVRVPDPDAPNDSEPLLADGFVITPANADVVDASLRLVDRIRARHPFTRLLGDLLCTNLKANRWAVPLADRGVEQVLAMRKDNHGVIDIDGAQMQHGWLHCAAAPMHLRPLPPDRATPNEWDKYHDEVEEFQRNWAHDRKASGLLQNPTSKWICPARAGKAGCWALGEAHFQAARELGLPIINPPDDWKTRKTCTNETVTFTPDPAEPAHQRKLMQRFYYGSRKWRRAFNRRSLVEGLFGIIKNPSRQRMRRGQNRMPGLAIASIIAAVKVSVYNEEALREWHDRTGLGPTDHPLLQPDPPYWGFRDLSEQEAKAIDAEYLRRHRGGNVSPIRKAA